MMPCSMRGIGKRSSEEFPNRFLLLCSNILLFITPTLTSFFVFYFELNHGINGIDYFKPNPTIYDKYSQYN